MAASAGRNFILKLGNAASPEVFTAVGGMRTTSIAINNSEVDVTNMDDAGVRKLLATAGVTSVSISANGVFIDSTGQDSIADAALARTHHNFELADAVTNNVKFAGRFQVTAFELTGEEGDAMLFSITLASAGAVTLTNA